VSVRGVLAAVDAWQRRHAPVAFVVAVGRKFSDDGASRLAALIAYYAFFSLFPLLLAFVSVLGFVLEDDPALRDEVVHSALARVPVIGQQLEDEVTPLTGSTPALIIGLAGALWAGMGVMLAISRAFQAVWDVPRMDQRGAIGLRVRGLALLALLGLLLISSVVLGGLAVDGLDAPGAERVAAGVVSVGGTALIFLAVFRLLGPDDVAWRDLAPGVALATAGSVVLQSAGAWYVNHVIAGATSTYGTFALVIGLLSWFWVGAHVILVAAEVNVVRRERLWPRSLTGRLEPADRRVLEATARIARSDPRAEITVRFHDDDP
jgi:YihY family inner membrane protein